MYDFPHILLFTFTSFFACLKKYRESPLKCMFFQLSLNLIRTFIWNLNSTLLYRIFIWSFILGAPALLLIEHWETKTIYHVLRFSLLLSLHIRWPNCIFKITGHFLKKVFTCLPMATQKGWQIQSTPPKTQQTQQNKGLCLKQLAV